MNLHIEPGSDIYLTREPRLSDPGSGAPVARPPGAGWSLVGVVESGGGLSFLWRRSHVYAEMEAHGTNMIPRMLFDSLVTCPLCGAYENQACRDLTTKKIARHLLTEVHQARRTAVLASGRFAAMLKKGGAKFEEPPPPVSLEPAQSASETEADGEPPRER